MVNIFHVYRVHHRPSSTRVRFRKRKKYHAKAWPVVTVAEIVCGLFAVALLFKPAVPSLTEPVDEPGPGECVACLAQAMNAFTLFW